MVGRALVFVMALFVQMPSSSAASSDMLEQLSQTDAIQQKATRDFLCSVKATDTQHKKLVTYERVISAKSAPDARADFMLKVNVWLMHTHYVLKMNTLECK